MSVSHTELQATLKERLARHNVPGASIAVLESGTLTSVAAGVCNVNTQVALTLDTLMHIGSITKVFNATLVMQLVDEGRIELDEPVLRYVPELKLQERCALEQITVRMLLDHTSGIDGDMLPDYGHDEETIEKGIARFAGLGQIHAPGAEFSYCNAGTMIAGYLAQRLTATSWYRLVRERIFAPLQMHCAVALPEEALLHRASVGHYLRPGSDTPVRTSFAFLPLSFAPAGATLMMSAADLIAFTQAHMAQGLGANGTRILSADSARAMQRIGVNNHGKGYTYLDMGLGWMVSEEGLLFHAGGGPGIVAALYAYPEQQSAIAVLTNAEHGLGLINEFVEPWLRQRGTTTPFGMARIERPSQPIRIDPGRYAGTYENNLSRFRIASTSEELTLSRQAKIPIYDSLSTEEGPAAPLVPLGGDRFLLDAGAGDLNRASAAARLFVFRNPDASGRMQHIGCIPRLWKRVS